MPNGKGGYFDHIDEMKNSYRSIIKARDALEGSLNNPNLSNIDRSILQEGVERANYYIDRIRELIRPYGGI